MTGHQIAHKLGLGSTTVYRHLGLNRFTAPKWTEEEIQELVDGYFENRPVREIAAKLGRSPTAVRIKMCRYRKEVKGDKKKIRAMRAITMALRAVRKADIFREVKG